MFNKLKIFFKLIHLHVFEFFLNADLDRATFLNCLRADILNEQVWRNDELCKVIELLQTRHGGKIQRELTCSRGEGPPAKKFKQEGQPSFRVSCKCSGMLGRKVSSQV